MLRIRIILMLNWILRQWSWSGPVSILWLQWYFVYHYLVSANLPITPSFKVFINKARFYTKCQDPDPLKFSGFLFKWSGFGTLFSRWPCTQPFLLYNYLECKLSNGTNVFCTLPLGKCACSFLSVFFIYNFRDFSSFLRDWKNKTCWSISLKKKKITDHSLSWTSEDL